MEIFINWFPYFLAIMGGCLILMVLFLFITNRHIKKKFNKMEETKN